MPQVATTIDLARQLRFGDSEVDEAAVVLAQMSVLIYRDLEAVVHTAESVGLKRCTAIDPSTTRDDDLFWLKLNPEAGQTFWLPSAKTPLGSPSMPFVGKSAAFISQALKHRIRQGSPILDPAATRSAPAGPTSVHVPGPSPKLRAHRNRAPRVLAGLFDDHAVIVFRGSATLADWGLNFCSWPAFALPLRHQGFEWAWRQVKAEVLAWLAQAAKQLGYPPSVYLGGHSLGGAIATLAAVDLSKEHHIARVVTLGSPRVGGWLFRSQYRSSPAAPASDGTTRLLPDVTTRWVHGGDAVAAILPPPLVAAHVVDGTRLAAKDRLPVEEYMPQNLMDTSALTGLVDHVFTGNAGPGSPLAHGRGSWTGDARRATSQVVIWLALSMPWAWWTRLFLPLLPMALEGMVRSGYHHKSLRYLGFMPATALFRAMFPPPPPASPAQGKKPGLHVVR